MGWVAVCVQDVVWVYQTQEIEEIIIGLIPSRRFVITHFLRTLRYRNGNEAKCECPEHFHFKMFVDNYSINIRYQPGALFIGFFHAFSLVLC